MFQRVQPVIYQSSLLRRFYSRGVYQYLCPWSIRSRCFTEFVPRNLPKGWDRWPISWVYLGKYAQKTCPKFHVRAHQLGCITVYIQRSLEGVVLWPIIGFASPIIFQKAFWGLMSMIYQFDAFHWLCLRNPPTVMPMTHHLDGPYRVCARRPADSNEVLFSFRRSSRVGGKFLIP